jgi:hypothetical protein
MRFLIAAAMFVVSVLLLLTGVAQRTIWAPPANVSISVKYVSTSPFVVIPHSTLALHKGTPTIRVSGDNSTFISTGREADVMAFVGKSPYVQLAVTSKKASIEPTKTFGGAPGFSPAGSDLWRSEVSGAGTSALEASPTGGGAALIASNGFKNAPNEVELVWPIVNDLTWSNIALISGLVVLLAAIALVIFHVTDRRRKRGPRRRLPKAPTGPKYRAKRKARFAPARGRRAAGRASLVIPATLATIGLLSGCSVGMTSSTQASASPSSTAAVVAPPVVVPVQLHRILDEVAAASKAADDGNNRKLLTPRFTGPALNLRAIHYYLRSKDNKIAALPSIVASPLSFSLPAASTAWPRSIMAVTDEVGDNALPQLIVMQQKSPRENYQVWYTVRLMPGAKIPAVPAADNGAIPVDAKSLFLKVPPLSLPAAYGDLINKGQSSLSAQLFDVAKDEFYKQVSESQAQQVANLKNGKITFTHKLGDANVIGLSTSQAGALVAVYMTDTYLIRPTKVGTAVGVSGQEALILGANGSTKGVRSIYGNMMLFFVPALSEATKIRLIGVTQGLVSVRGL